MGNSQQEVEQVMDTDTLLDCLQRGSQAPSQTDRLFDNAVSLSRDEFDRQFEAEVRSGEGFSVTPPAKTSDNSNQG